MKTPNDIRKLEDKLTTFLMINDVQIGMPLSPQNHHHVLGFEYDAMSHSIIVIIPDKLKRNLVAFLKKQGLENFYSRQIMEEPCFVMLIIYL